MIPLAKPYLTSNEINAVVDILRSGRIATGERVSLFEETFSRYIGRQYAVAVNSGTVALYLVLRILNLKHVIIPAITCPDVVNAVISAGATPIIAEVEAETHNLDPNFLSEDVLKSADGMIITHAYGHPVEIDELVDLCRSNQITLIEDFSQANGAWYKGRRCGSFGDVSITSFYAAKSMTTGYGGAIITDSKNIRDRARLGRGDQPYEYDGSLIPLNFKMTDFQAALGVEQLKRLDDLINKRRIVAQKYDKSFCDIKGIKLLSRKDYVTHCFYKYVICVLTMKKDEFITKMREHGVQVGTLNDPPLHQMNAVRAIVGCDCLLPVAEKVASTAVSLPMYPSMSQNDISLVTSSVRDVVR